MLIYRLIQFRDPIPDINVGVKVERKSFLDLSKSKAQKEVEISLQSFLNLRTEKKEIALEPVLFPIINGLVSGIRNKEIYAKDIRQKIKEEIAGYSVDPPTMSDSRILHHNRKYFWR
jgi:hypothetical protein